MATILDRFMAKVSREPNGCWIWKGRTLPNGYGQFKLRGRMASGPERQCRACGALRQRKFRLRRRR
jgi:hypothetical protein